MTDLLYNSKEKVKTLRNYLYANNLKEDEIDRVIEEALDDTFIKGLDAGCVVQRNNRKRIERAHETIENKGFEAWFNEVEDSIYQQKVKRK